MSFLEDFRRVDSEADHSYPSHDETAYELGAKQVFYDILETTRWGFVSQYVYELNGEFVSVVYEEGSGDSDIDYEPEYSEVEKQEVTITKYVFV